LRRPPGPVLDVPELRPALQRVRPAGHEPTPRLVGCRLTDRRATGRSPAGGGDPLSGRGRTRTGPPVGGADHRTGPVFSPYAEGAGVRLLTVSQLSDRRSTHVVPDRSQLRGKVKSRSRFRGAAIPATGRRP